MPAEWTRQHKILGKTEPRIFTPPLRPLTRKTTRGYEIIDFAEMIGEPLLPWQKWVVIHAMELLPDGSYRFRTVLIIVARQNGKSHLKRIVSLWRMYMDGATRIIGTAQDVALARDQWNMCQETIHACPDLEEEWGKVRNVNGDEWFEAAGCRYTIKAANRRAGRGGSNDEVNIDELREQVDWKAWAAVSKTTMARRNGQLWAMSNAGDDSSVVLNQLQDAGRSGSDASLFLAEYSAEDGCELDDIGQIAQANPGLGITVSYAAVRSAQGTDPPPIYRSEVLCQRVENTDAAIDLLAWRACADPAGTMDALAKRLIACFDVSPDGKHATLAVAGKRDDGIVRIEIAGAWHSTEQAWDELPGLLDALRPIATVWYPSGPGGAFSPMLRGRQGALELTGLKVAEACQVLAEVALGRKIVHNADPLLDAHIGGAQKLPAGDGWRFTRRGGPTMGHVDAAYAASGAIYGALTIAEPPRARIRVLAY